ncbi:MAG: tricarballylate utilization 4Fe-4S protein TcuB [Pseudomonadota bacterium]
MSPDVLTTAATTPLDGLVAEARRQAHICNACRYCEGYCAVFPALHARRAFAEADLVQLANLCHNCRGCYYACQYTAPHEFDLNLPKALGDLRQGSWEAHAWPGVLATAFHRHAGATAALMVAAVLALVVAAQALRPESGEGFYAVMSHTVMVAIFAPAFLLPLAAMAVSLRRYWQAAGGGAFAWVDLVEAGRMAATMRNLGGGHGEGCNFEDADRFTPARRHAHQLVLWGFVLCFAATSAGTVMHYVFGWEAPYGFFTPPKLLGVPGGLMLSAGALWLWHLRRKADPALGAEGVDGGANAFLWLLFATSTTGLLLYAATGTALVEALLPLHLATVLTLFLLTPYSKMAHGFYRMAALTLDAGRRRGTPG